MPEDYKDCLKQLNNELGKIECAWLNTEMRHLAQEVLQQKSWRLEGVLEKFCFVIILFLTLLLRWSLLTILGEGILCIIDNKCDLARYFLICLLLQAVIKKLKEENKREEGFKSIFQRRLCILAAPYPISLISFFYVLFSRSWCSVVLISIKPALESILL